MNETNNHQVFRQQLYQQAATWYLAMQEKPLNQQQQQEFKQWLASSPLHQEIWDNVTMFDQKLNRLPKQLTAATVRQLKSKKAHGLTKLCFAFISFLSALYAVQSIRQQDYLPELLSFDAIKIYKTKIGEQQQVMLSDGSQVWLNSNSKLRIKYNHQYRTLDLAKGEIYIQTHHDQFNRPFSVKTRHGNLLALGTIFNVQDSSQGTILMVEQGIVQVQTAHNQQKQNIIAQHAVRFDQRHIYVAPYQVTHLLWRHHLLVVNSMPLSQFISQLSQHYNGAIKVDSELGHVLVSGSYSTEDVEKTLSIIAETYHFDVEEIQPASFVLKRTQDRK